MGPHAPIPGLLADQEPVLVGHALRRCQPRHDYQARGTCHLADELAMGHCGYSGTAHRSERATWLADASYNNGRFNGRARRVEE